MKKYFRGGSIVVVGKYHEEVIYDVLSNDLQVTFDGKGGIAECTSSTQTGAHALTSTASVYSGKKKIDAFCEKSVKMIGRTQTIVLKAGDVRITIYQFVPAKARAIFYEISANKAGDYDFVLDLDHRRTTRFDFAANVESRFVPESALLYVHTNKRARLVLSCGTDAAYCRRLLPRFAEFEGQVEDEIASVKIPATAKTEKDKAVYTSSYLCALENYTEIGDYKCFSESVDRTYFRDSYWTVLPMYKSRPDLVRCQILTLAHGVEENGDCPAAVTVEWNPFFRNQYDSPSFFVLMVYDYINHTGDFSILDETVRGRTVFDWCALAVDKLALYEDETHLIVKAGPHNNRDWANEVNRTGYVTYVELHYARALECLSRIAGTRDASRARRYRAMYERTKTAINSLLWDDEKGYYVNYRDGDFVEDNLSVDTILAVLFGIADEEKTERLLDNVSAILESRNNKSQGAGDFGVMCVYPFYRGLGRTFHRNLQDYKFHNGAVWPYWSALVAYAQLMHGRDCTYALTSSFDWSVKHGSYTPVEYYSPLHPCGGCPQASDGDVAWVYDWRDGDFFKENETVWGTK